MKLPNVSVRKCALHAGLIDEHAEKKVLMSDDNVTSQPMIK